MFPLMLPVTRCTRERIQNRSNRPAVEDVPAACHRERIRTVDHARHKLLSAVEVRKSIFCLLIEGIERQIVRGKVTELCPLSKARDRV